MAHKAPDWLTTEMFSEVTGEEVTSLSLSRASPIGSHYGSVVTRVSLGLRSRIEPMMLIVKSELPEGRIKDFFNVPETIEHDFYYKLLPEARKITDVSFAPRAFPTKRPNSVIMEDLNCLGFTVADRSKQLDFDHCRLYMMAAAKLHAASFAVHKKYPELVESIGKEKMYLSDMKNRWKKSLEGGIVVFLNALDTTEYSRRVHKVITDVQEHLWNMIVDAHKKSNSINTLNQGDPWTTNMMFRYDDKGFPEEIKVIDFQCLRFASPATDIVWFLWCSANHDVKKHKLPDLYKIYLRSFNKNLTDLGCNEEFNEEDFMNDIRRLSPMVLFIVACIIPFLVPSDIAMMDSNKFYSQFYNEHWCNNEVPKYVEEMDNAGVFDYLDQYSNQVQKSC